MTYNELLADTNFICGTDSTSFANSDKVALFNRHYYKAAVDIYRTSGRYQWDDSNLASVPEVTVSMTESVKTVVLPALLKINAIEVKDAAGNWTRLQEIDMADLGQTITDFENTPGLPRYYDLKGNYVYLYPAPTSTSATLTSGLKFHVAREVDIFTTGDTTQEPGIPEPFHRILSLGAACDWLLVNGTSDQYNKWLGQYEQLRKELRDHFSDFNRDSRVAFKPAHRTEDYI